MAALNLAQLRHSIILTEYIADDAYWRSDPVQPGYGCCRAVSRTGRLHVALRTAIAHLKATSAYGT